MRASHASFEASRNEPLMLLAPHPPVRSSLLAFRAALALEYLDSAFSGATSFNQDLSSWNVAYVINFDRVFKDATSFNQDLSDWDITHNYDTSMEYMFEGATAFSIHLCWDEIPSTTTTYFMFSGTSGSANGCTPTLQPTISPQPTISLRPSIGVYRMEGTTELRAAVRAWCSDSTSAKVTYGPISMVSLLNWQLAALFFSFWMENRFVCPPLPPPSRAMYRRPNA